ncbi:MAG TPA: DUF4239 domain-containing protein [Pyrinomonadaceae bacterium]|nr:DUF4239 domain-containing protein [Pyrinomonadaceae bacterium]
MRTLLTGVLIIGAWVLLALAGLWLVRRRVPLTTLEAHHEVAGFIIGVLGAIYAVLLAFVVVVVWTDFEDARQNVSREGNHLLNLSRMVEGFPAESRAAAHGALRAYALLVLEEEWEAMARGEAGARSQAAMDSVWQTYRAVEPQTPRESALYAESLDHLTELSDARRLRLHASREGLPLILKIILWGGGVMTVAFTYFFGVRNLRSQTLMTAALSAVIAFILFLIVALDNPFAGSVRVSPAPIREALEKIDAASPNRSSWRITSRPPTSRKT